MSADVTVEIAFDAGYTTPAASRTWTDVSDYVELSETVTITRGRQDELSEVSPSTLALTFDNRDGRFTPGLSSSPYYPNVKIGRPIRVKVTPDGGSESIRFTGYVDEWPVEWDGTDAYARVPITATSRMARLGLAVQLPNVIAAEYDRDGVDAHYQLNDLSDRMGGNPLVSRGTGAAVTFDATGPGTDGISAAKFAGEKYLAAPLGVTLDASDGYWFEFFINTTASNAQVLAFDGAADFFVDAGLGAGKLIATLANVGTKVGPVINDGATHHVLVSVTATNFQFIVDGALWGEDPSAYSQTPAVGDLFLGRTNKRDLVGVPDFVGTLAHVAYGTHGITVERAAAHAAAGSAAFAGETPAARLVRYADYARVPAVEQSFATGSTPIVHIDTTGQTAISLMQLVASADGGILIDARDGTLTYQDRSARYSPPSVVTLRADSQEVESDYAPRLDRAVLLNDLTTKNIAGTLSVRALDETSRDEYGVHSEEIELATDNENELTSAAWWRVNTRAEPTPRVASLSVDALTRGGHDELLGLDVSSQITVTGLPAQAGASTADYFVEGYTETIGLASHRFTFNVSDAGAWLGTWVLDSATRSQLDSTTVLAY